MSTNAGLDKFLEERRRQVEEALDHYLPASPACPPVIAEAMRYSVVAGGKRLRPILTLASAEAVAQRDQPKMNAGDTIEAAVALALPAACAIELIHSYSLVHDDLPAMDNDTLRRGRPTTHVVFGEGLAILAGDGLLTEAFRLIAREPTGAGHLAFRKLRIIEIIAEAAGAEGMVGGQAIDLQAIGAGMRSRSDTVRAPQALDADALSDMHRRKTGALIRAAAVSGAIMAGGAEPLVNAVDRYAAELGLAFQIIDDILDVEGVADEIGKTAGKDAAAGKPTYPAVYGLAESRRLARECVGRAKSALASEGLGGHLDRLADWVATRRS